jgi:hypothetical protein
MDDSDDEAAITNAYAPGGAYNANQISLQIYENDKYFQSLISQANLAINRLDHAEELQEVELEMLLNCNYQGTEPTIYIYKHCKRFDHFEREVKRRRKTYNDRKNVLQNYIMVNF